MSTFATDIDAIVAELNPQQRSAVLHRGGPVLVLAGAGTGKTRVITVRIAHMVMGGMAPEHILAITFTNKAAGEMAERVAGFLGQEATRRMTIGTFHSLGLRMLEKDARRLGYKRGVSLLDAADQNTAVRQCLKQLRIDPRRHDPATFLSAISNARNAGITPEMMGADRGRRLTARVYQAYLDWLKAYHAMDFDDLILRAVQLLDEHEDLRRKWRERFETVLVDEFQDTNGMQLQLVRRLAQEHRSLCVVGDDDQSIYGWRGANIQNILGFETHFPDATAVALTQNYRSTGHILAAANSVIGNNSARREKELWTDVGAGEPVRVVMCKDPGAEASYIAAEICRVRAAENRPYRDFGVLFRTASQTTAIEEAFRMAGVPYRLVGAYAFFERKEVKDMLSYLKLTLNPLDETSLLRVINFPQRGMGPKAIAALHDFAHDHGIDLWQAVGRSDEMAALNRRQKAKMAEFVRCITAAEARHKRDGNIQELFDSLVTETGAEEAWIRDPTEGPGGARRWRNIEHLKRLIERYETRNPTGNLKDWLRLVHLDSRHQSQEESEKDEVVMYTLHASKGLEWPVCFMIGCQEGILPHQRAIDDNRGDVSEERRLFYVGITRARRRCYLTLSKMRRKYHGMEPTRPSRFLREIPASHRVDIDRHTEGGGVAAKKEQLDRFAALRARLAKSKS